MDAKELCTYFLLQRTFSKLMNPVQVKRCYALGSLQHNLKFFSFTFQQLKLSKMLNKAIEQK